MMRRGGWLVAMLLLSGAAGPVAPVVAVLRVAVPLAPAPAAATRALIRTAPAQIAARLMAVPGGVAAGWDVAALDPVVLAQACAAGRVTRLDWARLQAERPGAAAGSARGVPAMPAIAAAAMSACGGGAVARSLVLAWDSRRQGAAPGWADFWDVARLPGQRGLRRGAAGTMEIALLADGVAPRDVYAVLGSARGVDRALRKLDQLRPYISWWRTDAQAVGLIGSGRVRMTSAPDDALAQTSAGLRGRFGVQHAGSLVWVWRWAVAAACKQPDAAMRLVAFAATQPGPADAGADTLTVDGGFWQLHGAALEQRFAAWLR